MAQWSFSFLFKLKMFHVGCMLMSMQHVHVLDRRYPCNISNRGLCDFLDVQPPTPNFHFHLPTVPRINVTKCIIYYHARTISTI